jgi:sec-independent protein translocase protein TatA
MFKNIGTTEIIIIAVVLVILFGGKKIPEFVRSLGQSVKEFRKAVTDEDSKKDNADTKSE